MEQRFGFIHDNMDLKVLILFILRRLPGPVLYENLMDVTLLCDDGIGYFDFSSCLADLVSTEHVCLKDEKYSCTEKGNTNGEITESSLPYSVRMRAEKAASALSHMIKRDSMIVASHEMRQLGGFTVKLSMSDGVGTVISMELLSGDDKQTKKMEDNFRKNAENIYSKIVEILLEEDK
jgi:hypothetical protein